MSWCLGGCYLLLAKQFRTGAERLHLFPHHILGDEGVAGEGAEAAVGGGGDAGEIADYLEVSPLFGGMYHWDELAAVIAAHEAGELGTIG